MSEVRTTSSTGGQKGVKPERHDLIPRKAVAWIARVFGFGASKYEDHNWRLGYEWGKSLASLQRHIDEFVEGNSYDDESGLPHLAHAGFHILALLTWFEEQGEGPDNPFDDRWMHSMERARRALEAESDPDFDAIADDILSERGHHNPATRRWDRTPLSFVEDYDTPPPPAAVAAMQIHIHAIDEKARRLTTELIHEAVNQRGIRRENLRF